jgi:hypothetical protein
VISLDYRIQTSVQEIFGRVQSVSDSNSNRVMRDRDGEKAIGHPPWCRRPAFLDQSISPPPKGRGALPFLLRGGTLPTMCETVAEP